MGGVWVEAGGVNARWRRGVSTHVARSSIQKWRFPLYSYVGWQPEGEPRKPGERPFCSIRGREVQHVVPLFVRLSIGCASAVVQTCIRHTPFASSRAVDGCNNGSHKRLFRVLTCLEFVYLHRDGGEEFIFLVSAVV